MMFGTSWFFNNDLPILSNIQSGVPFSIKLVYSELWVQVHNLPASLMTEVMAK